MKIQLISSYLLSALLVLSPLAVQADIVDTTQLLAQENRSTQIQVIETYMASEAVQSQMETLGVSSEMAAERVASMTDAQLQQMVSGIESMPAGGDGLGVLVTVLVILLLLEILGVINISAKI